MDKFKHPNINLNMTLFASLYNKTHYNLIITRN